MNEHHLIAGDIVKPREQNCQSTLPCKLCFTVVLFCFDSFACFSAFVLVVWAVYVASILETRFHFATSSFCKDYIYQLYYNAEA